MFKSCPHCGLHYEIEPGFYTGAMYISYAFSVVIFTMTGVMLYYLFGDPGIWVYTGFTFLVILVLFPLLIRYSRTIYLHLFGGVKFNSGYSK